MKTIIKVLILGFTLAAGATVLTLIVRMDSAHAEKSTATTQPAKAAKPPVAKADAVDAAQLDAALAHMRELNAAAKPYQDAIIRFGKKYEVDPSKYGESWGIDFQTGAITRAPAPQMAQAAPKAAEKPSAPPKAPVKQ